MEQLTITRRFQVPLDFAFSWLTDYQPDVMVIFGGKAGFRKIERIAPNQLHLRNNFLETKFIEDMVVTLFPPDRWDVRGTVLDKEKALAKYNQKFRLESISAENTRMIMVLESEPLTFAARIYAFFRWSNTVKEFERQNDLLAVEIAKEYKSSPVHY